MRFKHWSWGSTVVDRLQLLGAGRWDLRTKETKTKRSVLARPAYSQQFIPALLWPAHASEDHLSFTALFSD